MSLPLPHMSLTDLDSRARDIFRDIVESSFIEVIIQSLEKLSMVDFFNSVKLHNIRVVDIMAYPAPPGFDFFLNGGSAPPVSCSLYHKAWPVACFDESKTH